MSTVERSEAATFARARRRRPYRRLVNVIRRAKPADLLSLDEATRRLRPFARTYVGMRAIPLDGVVGTDSRSSDFDRSFLPRRADMGLRWHRVEGAFPDGVFPPIVAYKLGDAYFVLDGHHRVAIARQRGMQWIDADVTELRTRWRLSPDTDVVELIHAEQERIFFEESGLDRVRPDLAVRVSRPVGYVELLETIQLHGYHAMLAAGRALGRAEIAAAWLEQVYEPAVEAIRRETLERDFPGASDADLFLYVWRHRRELIPDRGCRPLAHTVREVVRNRRRPRLLALAKR
jgi:hypothetical protein